MHFAFAEVMISKSFACFAASTLFLGALVVGCSNDAPEGANDDGCCPRAETLSGCMQLGGSETCSDTCDFFCSDNWRVEKDERGCEIWSYDIRSPKGDEDQFCQVKRDSDAGPTNVK